MKTETRLFALTVSVTLFGIFASAAEARSRRGYDQEQPPEPLYSGRNVVVCQKMCPQDFSPCDPIYFKTADGRCASVRTR